MMEDDSAERFPGEARGREDARYDARHREGYYGSGGSYGYGGGFEHEGERGYQPRDERGQYGRGDEEFYEETGGFGRGVSGYGAAGLGYPGRGEDRYGSSGSRDNVRRPGPRDDARQGYSQDAGYAQSGGEHRERTGQGGGYSSPEPRPSGGGGFGGDPRQRFYGRSSSPTGQPSRGRFYGRTPQGYTRSDDRIREDVCDALSHGHIDPSEISVKVENGVVTLEGFASDRGVKFHAEEVADSVLGVKEVDNRLRVRKAQSTSESENAWTPTREDTREQREDKGPRNGTANPTRS